MYKPAQVIGYNVKTRREALGMTAEDLGERLEPYLRNKWPRQTVYLLEQGNRRVTADEAVALAHILGTTVADLFTPGPEVDAVIVGDKVIEREALLVEASESEGELFRHFQALLRARRDVSALTAAEDVVLANLDDVFRGKAPTTPDDVDTDTTNVILNASNMTRLRAMERAAKWYEPEVKGEPFRLPDNLKAAAPKGQDDE